MTGFLLDTNIVSELRKRSRADVGLLSWLAENQAEEFWLSVLVVGDAFARLKLNLCRHSAALR